MSEELAYSIHLGSDKNRSKVAKQVAKNNVSSTTSFTNNSIQNAQQLSKVNKHNLRKYDNQKEKIRVIYGSDDIYKDVQNLYLQEFLQAQEEYNKKQTRDDRKIKNYFEHISEDKLRDLACELVIELGDMDFWNDKNEDYKLKMVNVYKEQVDDLMKIVPEFKVANAVIHFDETSPHLHIVGVPVKDNNKRGMKKQIAKSKIFTKESLTELQDKMRKFCIKSYNKVYEKDSIVKKKQKGRNQDIKVSDMDNYRKLKQEREENSKKLNIANNKSDKLNENAEKVNKVIDNLKSTKFNKDNKIISNENIDKIKALTEQIKDTTESIKNVNDLNITIDEIEGKYYNLKVENRELKNANTYMKNKINELEDTIKSKNSVIDKLKMKINELEDKLMVFKSFWKRIINRFQFNVYEEKNKDSKKQKYTKVMEDLYVNNEISDYERDLIQDIRKKIKSEDEIKNNKLNRNNDIRF